ncbi:hypothetical protein QOT17_016298 [Balamuthia mandrillaris]
MTITGPSRTFSRVALLLCCLFLLAASLFSVPCFGGTANDDYDYDLDLDLGQTNDHEEADERRTGEPPMAEEEEKKVFDVIGKMFVSDAERKGIWAFDALNLIPSSSNNKERGGGRGGPAVTFFRDHLLEAGVSEFIEALEPYPTGVAVVEASGHGTLLASVSGKQFILYQLLAPSGSNEGKTEVKAHMVLPSWGLSLLPSFSQLTSTSSKQEEEEDREDIPAAATLEGGKGEEEKEDAKEILVLGEEGEWRKVTRRRVVKKLEEKEEDVSLEFFVTLPKEGRVLRVFPETRYLQVVYGRTDRKSFMLDADRILDVQTWKQEHESKMKPGIIPSFVTWGSGHDHLLLSSFKDNSVYHLDPETGELGLFIEDVKGPMGLLLRDNSLHFDRELCFSSPSDLRAKIPSSSENKNRQTVNKWIQDRKDEEKQQRGGWDLFVASAEEGAVLRFDGVTGEFVDEFIAAGDLWNHKPIGLGLSPYDGYLYVSLKKEENKNKPPGYILRFDAVSGTFVDSLEDVVPSLKEEMTHPSFLSWDIEFEHSPCVREMKPAGMQHGIYRMNWGKQRNTKRPARS